MNILAPRNVWLSYKKDVIWVFSEVLEELLMGSILLTYVALQELESTGRRSRRAFLHA